MCWRNALNPFTFLSTASITQKCESGTKNADRHTRIYALFQVPVRNKAVFKWKAWRKAKIILVGILCLLCGNVLQKSNWPVIRCVFSQLHCTTNALHCLLQPLDVPDYDELRRQATMTHEEKRQELLKRPLEGYIQNPITHLAYSSSGCFSRLDSIYAKFMSFL